MCVVGKELRLGHKPKFSTRGSGWGKLSLLFCSAAKLILFLQCTATCERFLYIWSKGSFPESNEKCSLLAERRTNDVYGYGAIGCWQRKRKQASFLYLTTDNSHTPFRPTFTPQECMLMTLLRAMQRICSFFIPSMNDF